MTIRLQYRVLAVAAAGLLLAACSARNDVTAPVSGHANTTLHARAAQRIELPGAADSAMPGAIAATATVGRLQPVAPEIIRLPDGTVGGKVAAQYFDTVVACRQPDGTFSTQCTPAPAPAPEPRR